MADGEQLRPYQPIPSTQLDLSEPEGVYLVPQLLIAGGMNLIVAQAGTGKSVLVKRFSKAFATGGEVLGRTFPHKKNTVVDLETPELIFRHQMRIIGTHPDISIIRPDQWIDLSRGGIRKFEEELEKDGSEVLFIDPLSLAWRMADENSNSEADIQLGELKLMCMRLGLTLVYTWNTGQNAPNDKMFISRGASARADRADIILHYRRRDMLGRALKVIKDKFQEPSYEVGFTFVDDQYDFMVDSETGTGKVPTRTEQCQAQILALIVEGVSERRDFLARLNIQNFSEQQVDRALQSLVDSKTIMSLQRGQYQLA